jgi:SpoVK/Ycf46/Vps4 family AAA+-type ATPase
VIEQLLSQIQGTGLEELEPGPMPIIPKTLWAQIEEWLLAWKHAEALRKEGLQAPGAMLLYGPTGSGKTSLARAILKHMGGRPGVILEAHNALTKMFGESAANVAKGFRAAQAMDALLVVEEIDALGMSRREEGGACGGEENKITIALMRMVESATSPVIATTNFKDALDPALLRRFELKIEVPSADEKARRHILAKILGEPPSDEMVALPLVDSIPLAHRIRRAAFIAKLESGGKR